MCSDTSAMSRRRCGGPGTSGVSRTAVNELVMTPPDELTRSSPAPGTAQEWNARGIAFRDQGKLLESIDCYRRAIQINENYAPAHNNLGLVLRDLLRLDES